MLFPYSIVRWIKGVEEIEIDACGDSPGLSSEEINSKYDMLLLPFANAFRKNYIAALIRWTSLIQQLTIPCVVMGIGLQAGISDNGGNVEYKFSFDEDVLNFCNAVLEKFNQIGVRGEITKKYLVGIGVPENSGCVIGCPSMFMNGTDKAPIRKPDFSSIDKIGFNTAKNNRCVPIIEYWMFVYKNSMFISQEIWEHIMLHTGIGTQEEGDYDEFNRKYDEALKTYCIFLDSNTVRYRIPNSRISFSDEVIQVGGDTTLQHIAGYPEKHTCQ